MAINNELNARLQHAVEENHGEVNQTPSNLSVPLKGEIIFNSNLTNFKVGDGIKNYGTLTDFITGGGTLPVATDSVLGGIKIGYTQNSNNYPVLLGSNTGDTSSERAYVNVPIGNGTHSMSAQNIAGGSITTFSSFSANNTNNYSIIFKAGEFSDFSIVSPDTVDYTQYTSSITTNPYIKAHVGLPSGWNDGMISGFYKSNPLIISRDGINLRSAIENSNNTNAGLSIGLNAATTATLGGVIVSHNNTTGLKNPVDQRQKYPIAINNQGLICTIVPKAQATGTDNNPGLLQVAADAIPNNVFINDKFVDAIPVFYGNSSNTVLWRYTSEEGEEYSKDKYIPSQEPTNFEGHYVNITDIVNGLIRNPDLLSDLKKALEQEK